MVIMASSGEISLSSADPADVTRYAGDILVGDRDGVAVVTRARIDEVIAGLEDVRQKEHETGERIAAGATIPSWVDELIGSSRTRLID